MDGVQWRHCLSDAAVILFPLGGKERDTVWIRQRRLSNITEHHHRRGGGEALPALRLLNAPVSVSAGRIAFLTHALIKKCFAAERRDSRLHKAARVILSARRTCQAIILIPARLLSAGLSRAREPKERLEGLKRNHPIADSALSAVKTLLFYLNNSSRGGRATLRCPPSMRAR